MGNYREPPKRRRVEVPFPAAKGNNQRRPGRSHQSDTGANRGLINAGIVVVVTLLTTVLLLAISGQLSDTTSANLLGASPAPVLPVTALPQLSPTPSPQTTHAAATSAAEKPSPIPVSTPDDSEVQAAIDTKLDSDASLAQLGITATVNNGNVVLVGTAPSDEMKGKVERLVRAVKGVRQVDNQIVVISQ